MISSSYLRIYLFRERKVLFFIFFELTNVKMHDFINCTFEIVADLINLK